jgi:hypothetical protein
MQRVFGALAIFGGWLCILLSALFGLIATQFLGLDHVEGDLPPSGLYGVPAVVVVWVAIATAVLAAVPVATAVFAPDPSRRLYIAAAVMGITGVALLPDELGRAYSAAILPGAALFAAGGWWTHQAGAIGAESDALVRTGTPATEPAPGLPPEMSGPGPIASSSSGAGSVPPASAPGNRTGRRQARASAKSRAAADAECPWCSARVVAGAERCPSCGAALISRTEAVEVPISGVTAVAPELRVYQEKVALAKKRPGLMSLVMGEPDDRLVAPGEPVDLEVLRPPSAEVRAEMERLDREIAAGTIVGEGAAAPETGAAEAVAPEAAEPEAGPISDPRPRPDS